ncbi:MAG: hypothetical protein ACRDH8_14205 [Actinomycetota bacterium]
MAGLRANARQLVEATLLGCGIGKSASPMTVVDREAWEAAAGVTVGTTAPRSGSSDDGTLVSIGELPLGAGQIRIVDGPCPRRRKRTTIGTACATTA